MAEFDKKAATWDDDPERVDRANVIAKSLSKSLDLKSFGSSLEYGSGTGLLSFALSGQLSNIILMDESKEMINLARLKCEAIGINDIKPLQYDLLKQPLPEFKVDFIYILLTLHHIKDTEAILKKFNQLLNPGGFLSIIDLEKEDGSFHEHTTHFHNGFDRPKLETKLLNTGFVPESYEVCYELERDYDNTKKKYPLFLLISKKSD